MPIIANPDYYNSDWGKVAQNMGVALFGDPELNVKRDLAGAQKQNFLADARKANAAAAIDEWRNQGQKNIQAAIDAANGDPSMLQRLYTSPAYIGALSAFGKDATDVAGATARSNATGEALRGTQAGGQTSLILQGVKPDLDFAANPTAQEYLLNKKYGASLNEATSTANIAAGEKSDEFYNAPQNLGLNETRVYTDKFLNRSGLKGTIGNRLFGLEDEKPVVGAAANRIAAGRALPNDAALVAQAGNKGNNRMVTSKDIGDAQAIALGRMNAADTSNPDKPTYSEGALAHIPRDRLQAAQQAASKAIQTYGTITAGADAFQAALGYAPGTNYDEGSMWRLATSGFKEPQAEALDPPETRKIGTERFSSKYGWGRWDGKQWVAVSGPTPGSMREGELY